MTKKVQDFYRSIQFTIFVQMYELVKENKKKAFVFIVFELWVHSLVFQHLKELKTLREILPF